MPYYIHSATYPPIKHVFNCTPSTTPTTNICPNNTSTSHGRSHSPSRDSGKDTPLYRISDRVEVDQGRGKFLPGTVTKLRLDGTFDVEMDKGDVARQVDFERIRNTTKRRRRHDDDDDDDESKSPSSRRRKESSRRRDREGDGKDGDDDDDDPKYPAEPSFRSGNTILPVNLINNSPTFH